MSLSTGIFSETGSIIEARGNYLQTILDDGRMPVARRTEFKRQPSSLQILRFVGDLQRHGEWRLEQDQFDESGATGFRRRRLFAQHVFAVGGIGKESFTDFLDSIEEYNPFGETWTLLPSNGLAAPRAHHTVTRLADGITLLIAGGANATGLLPSAELLTKPR